MKLLLHRFPSARRHVAWYHIGRPIIAVALLAAIVIGWKGWVLYSQIQAIQADLQAIEQGVRSRPSIYALPSLAPLLAQLRGDAAALRSEAAPLLPITGRLGGLPGSGADLVAAEPLLDLLGELAAAADDTCAALCPLVSADGRTLAAGADLANQLAISQPRLLAARGALDHASAAYARIANDRLSPWLASRLQQVGALLPLARDGLDLAVAAPDLLGARGPSSYLLLAQDINEQRPTGGFIGGVGVATLERGRVTEFSLRDSNGIDDLAHYTYPLPPEPLRRYLGLQLWLLRDANWTADFPSAARQALAFYQIGQKRELDGAIAFDQTALKLLLDAIGPVQVTDAPRLVSGDTVIQYMYEQYSLNYPKRRKTFMEPLGRAVLRRLTGELDLPQLTALAHAFQRAVEERHVLIYVRQVRAASVLARHGWDGAVLPEAQDFLMVVDSNVGYNKVLPNIAEIISYTVDLSEPGAPLATLTVRHTNRQPPTRECSWRQRNRIRRYEDTFADCYWDYLRALVPAGSQLVASQTSPTPGEWLFSGEDEHGAVTLGPGEGNSFSLETLVVVPMGAERHTTFRYQLPASTVARDAAGWHYRLKLQKQPGTDALTVNLRARLPAHAQVTSLRPDHTLRQEGDTVVATVDLDRDQSIELSFTAP